MIKVRVDNSETSRRTELVEKTTIIIKKVKTMF